MKNLSRKEKRLIKKYPFLKDITLVPSVKDYRVINGTPMSIYYGGGTGGGYEPDLQTIGITSNGTLRVIDYISYTEAYNSFCLESFAVELDLRLENVEESLSTITPKVERALLTPLTTPTAPELVGIDTTNTQARVKIGDGLSYDSDTDTIKVDENEYQKKQDNNLQTTNKTIVGAINEINSNLPTPETQVLLWTNDNPTSELDRTNIPITNLSQYKKFIYTFHIQNTDSADRYYVEIVEIPQILNSTIVSHGTLHEYNGKIYQRLLGFNFTDNQIEIDVAYVVNTYGVAAVENSKQIILSIIGVK